MIANSTDKSSPILSSEFDEWMSAIGYFESNPTIAVATSGGADSMALLLLAKAWAENLNGNVISLTVNHNLRPEAAKEALIIEQWCREHNIQHKTLHWEHYTPQISSIQANAREARYQLMASWCLNNNILHLLTAHHRDDQAETMFFRLARGSNLEGLSSMPSQTIIHGLRLIRPLLQVPKYRLVDTLKAHGQKWLEDPSNENILYTRVNIRKQLAKSLNEEPIKQKANYITSTLGIFRNLLENKLAGEIIKTVEIYPQGYAIIDSNRLNNCDKEIAIKILGAVIQSVSGAEHPPRREKLIDLFQSISSNKLSSKRSLGGLLFEKIDSQKILIYREVNAIEKPVSIPINTPTPWDNRFMLELSGNASSPKHIELRALGSNGLAQIKEFSPSLLRNLPPARILRTIPSMWILEELACVPHIGYVSKRATALNIKPSVQFYPAKPLAGSGFFAINNGV